MSDNPAQQVLSDLFGYLESLETQSGAILQILRDKGVVTDQQLTPYLDQAANASSVKWRAARVRMEHLFAVSDPAPAVSAPNDQPAAAKESSDPGRKAETSAKKDDKSEDKGAAGNGRSVKDAAGSSAQEESDRQQSDSPRKETEAPLETQSKEQPRKAS